MQLNSFKKLASLIVLGVMGVSVLPAIQVARAKPVNLKVASVCMNAKLDKEANLATFTSYIEEASREGVHLIVFPEIGLQQNPGWGYISNIPTQAEFDYVRDTAETIPGPSTNRLVEVANTFRIMVVFGMTELGSNGYLYNASVLLGPDGVLHNYRKKGLWSTGVQGPSGNEHLFWRRGAENGAVVSSPLGKVGMMICREMWDNYASSLVSKGADFLVTPAAWPALWGSYYESRATANAIQARRWHIVSNQRGQVGYAIGYGHSCIVNPDGRIVADTGDSEGMVIVETDIMLPPPSIVDFNGDGIVDSADMCMMVDHWLTDDPLFDIAPRPFGDGIVDVLDLILLAEHLFEEYPPVKPVE